MAFVLAERTRERITDTGTGTVISLAGVLALNQRTFDVGVGVGNETFYIILSGNNVDWEEGIGSVSSTGHFSRDTVTKNSAGTTARISMSGVSRIFAAIPGDLGLMFTKYFGGDAARRIIRYSQVTGRYEATLDNASWKQSVSMATEVALPANTYSNGTAGVGATLTGNSNGALTVDGVLSVVGYRVLVKNEANNLRNGIYVVTQAGDVSHPYILTRAKDYDDPSDLNEGDCVAVGAAGTVNGRTIWTMATADTSISIGTTTDIQWYIVGARPSSALDLLGGTPGEILYRGATAWQPLAIGADGKVLTAVSGLPSWEDASGGGGASVNFVGDWDIDDSYSPGDVTRYGSSFYEANASIAAGALASPTLDGYATVTGNGTSGTVALTTTQTDDVIFAVVLLNGSGSVTGIASSGLTFTKAFEVTAGGRTEVWWAPAGAAITAQSIVVSLSATLDISVHAFGVHGANLANPFDADPSLPASSVTNAVTLSTINPFGMIVFQDRESGSIGFDWTVVPSGFTQIDLTSYLPVANNLSYKTVSAAQTALTIAATGAGAGVTQSIGFAITAGNAPPSLDSRWSLISATDDQSLDAKFGSTQGSLIARGASAWSAIAPGTTGQVLTMGASDPAWADGGGGGGGGGTPPTIVQVAESVGATSAVTFGASPSAGNLLLAVGTHWSNGVGPSSGWVGIIVTDGSSTDGTLAAYKVCGAGESSTQTPFSASSGGQSTAVIELSGVGGAPAMSGRFQESGGSTLSLSSFNSASGLVVGAFSVQGSSYDFAVSGATVDANVTGTTSNNSPRRIKSFHVASGSSPAVVTATLDTGHSSAGFIFFVPGASGGGGGGGGGGLWGQYIPGVLTQALSGYTTWVNQGTGSVSDTGAGFTITAPNVGGGNSMRMLAKTKAAQPCSYAALVALNGIGNYTWAGIGLTDGTKCETIELGFKNNGWVIHVVKWSGVTSLSSVPVEIGMPSNPCWLRVREDATNIYFEACASGDEDADYYPVFTEAKAAFLGTITQVFLFANGDGQQAKASFLATSTNGVADA